MNVNYGIVNSILDGAITYNYDPAIPGLDSIYYNTKAVSHIVDMSIALTELAISAASLVNPSPAQVDTLVSILDQTISRIQTSPATYRQAINRFNLLSFTIPSLVSVMTYEVDNIENTQRFNVLCTIKNISNNPVHQVAVTLGNLDTLSSSVQIIPFSDTLYSVLIPNEEKTLTWEVHRRSSNNLLGLSLAVHPHNIPGDFQGDTRTITHFARLQSPAIKGYLVGQNTYAYPNPFNPEVEPARFRFKLGKDGHVTITVYDISNTKVKEVISAEPLSAGVEQSVAWDGRNERGEFVGNGVYFYIIESSSGERAVGKIAVLR